jgi:hypothetical protein
MNLSIQIIALCLIALGIGIDALRFHRKNR